MVGRATVERMDGSDAWELGRQVLEGGELDV